ncbi:MAG: lipoprotein LpqH [Micropruina sp.]|uniref:lipoprotein LpqH n=1 Tax=Micropruina sp. TaxID=2737536 RepID=UPI0039E6D340
MITREQSRIRAWRRIGTPAVATALIGLVLGGCARVNPLSTTAPSDTPIASASGTPGTSSESPSPSLSPSAPASDGPEVAATGTLKLYSPASTKLAGTCRSIAGVPTLTVADHTNDFFETVDVVVALSAQKKAVQKLTIQLGEDSELVKRSLSYDAAQPAKDTSAEVTAKGSEYTVSGKLASEENGKAAGTMPVTLVVTCAGPDW